LGSEVLLLCNQPRRLRWNLFLICLLLQSAVTVVDTVHVCLPLPLPTPVLSAPGTSVTRSQHRAMLVSVLVLAVANTIGYWVLGGFLGIVLTLALIINS